MPEEKPPIGVLPRWRYEELQDAERIDELSRAIVRYRAAGEVCPPEWAQEIAELGAKRRTSKSVEKSKKHLLKFNVNDNVWIKLTQTGRKHLGNIPYAGELFNRIDAEGWLNMQLWEVMHIFGPMIYNGATPPFETDIYFTVTTWARADRFENGPGPSGGYDSRIELTEQALRLGLNALARVHALESALRAACDATLNTTPPSERAAVRAALEFLSRRMATALRAAKEVDHG